MIAIAGSIYLLGTFSTDVLSLVLLLTGQISYSVLTDLQLIVWTDKEAENVSLYIPNIFQIHQIER